MTEKYILGIDTGGTFTDSVVMDFNTKEVISSSKALTTKENLETGIKNSIDGLEFDDFSRLSLVSLSTTLATNAIVEGKGCSTGLILIGKDIEEPLPAEEVCCIHGTVDIKGRIREQIREEELGEVIRKLRGRVEAMAISCYAGSKNPLLEQQVRSIVEDELSLPVFAAHELSSDLGYLERTVTSVLNARLIRIIRDFIDTTKRALLSRGISAPVMIVKGDGGLMDEATARNRPIETILSGPAASTLGAVHLAGLDDAIIADIGGTTTDIVYINRGQTRVVDSGARVGGWRTHVKAADVHTYGIGGDSRICIDDQGEISIGPEKVEPLGVISMRYAKAKGEIRRTAERDFNELSLYRRGFANISRNIEHIEEEILNAIGDGVLSELSICEKLARGETLSDIHAVLSEMTREGFLIKSGLTPTDILHSTGEFTAFDREASELGIENFIRRCRRNREDFIDAVKSCMRKKLYRTIISSAAMFDGCPADMTESEASSYLIDKSVSSGENEFLHSKFKLGLPIIGAGAPAGAWLADVAEMLGAELIIPDYGGVNSAVGAALCKISAYASATIRPAEKEGSFVLFLYDEIIECDSLEEAEEKGKSSIEKKVREDVAASGGRDISVNISLKPVYTQFYNATEKTFIEIRMSAEAFAWPSIVLGK